MTVIGGVERPVPRGGSWDERRRRVVLHVWGFTAEDARAAEADARKSPRAYSWQITEVIRSSGAPCPIPSSDSLALEQHAAYDAAWAAYPEWGAVR